MAVKVVGLDKDLEQKFWDHVRKDPLNYYFFIFDRTLHNKDTEILMAMEGERIEGMMLVFKKSVIQIRGNRITVDTLLNHLNLDMVELSSPRDCRDLVQKRYRAPREYEIVLMHLEKGNENVLKKHETVRLPENSAEEVAELLRESNPEWWGDTKVEDIRKSFDSSYWLGILSEGKVVSVGVTRFVDFGCNIGIVATHKDFRKRGCATSIVSALVEEIFRRGDRALIHVLSDNASAIRAYEKVGFLPFQTYYQIKGGQRITGG